MMKRSKGSPAAPSRDVVDAGRIQGDSAGICRCDQIDDPAPPNVHDIRVVPPRAITKKQPVFDISHIPI